MIEKTRRRFILVSILAMSAAIICVVTALNIAVLTVAHHELAETLDFIIRFSSPSPEEMRFRRRETMFQQSENADLGTLRQHPEEVDREFSPRRMRLLSEARYFIVTQEEQSQPHIINHLYTDDTTDGELILLAEQADKADGQQHRFGDYLYRYVTNAAGKPVGFFLNCETRLESLRRLMRFSVTISLCCILIAFLFLLLVSRKMIAPLTENFKRMQRFITNASHELKTPLTVISANMDVLALDQPENSWVRSTQKQTANLRRMVDEMLYLTRIEEKDIPLTLQHIALDALVRDAADPFAAMTEFGGGSMQLEIQDALTVVCDEAAILRLVNILLDNAVKYAPSGSDITVRCLSRGRNAVIETENMTEAPLSPEQCRRLFDRFYRADESRNKSTHSGYGIGLAIASAVAEKHGGRMEARMNGDHLIIRCIIPQRS